MFTSQFNIGPYRFASEVIEAYLMEISAGSTGYSMDFLSKRLFADNVGNIAAYKPKEFSPILDAGSPIFYLCAHGDYSGDDWCYKTDENKLIPVKEKLENVVTEKYRGAILLSCNPRKSKITSSPIPIIYYMDKIYFHDTDPIETYYPGNMQVRPHNPLDVVLPFLDMLHSFERICRMSHGHTKHMRILHHIYQTRIKRATEACSSL